MALKIYSPFDETLIDEVELTSKETAEKFVALADATFKDRKKWLKPYERIEILSKTLGILRREKELLIKTAVLEGGKPWIDSEIEMERALQGIQIAVQTLQSSHGQEIPMGLTQSSADRIAYTYREPVGPVFAVSAFNHPLNLIVHQVIPAVATGCPVLVKPASKTPLSCFHIVNALYEAGLPTQWCHVLLSDHATTEKIVQDERIAFLSFIGSAKLGWHLRSKLAPGAHCTLEHGGAAPVIIAPDAEITASIPALIKGGFYHAGQVCVSVQRIFVHESIASSFCEQLVAKTTALVVGDPLNPKTEVGPLVSPAEVNRMEEWVLEAISAGAEVLCGAKKLSLSCYAPTILLIPLHTVVFLRKRFLGQLFVYNL